MRARLPPRKLTARSPTIEASGSRSPIMALLDFARGRTGHLQPLSERASAADKQQGTWRKLVLEFVGTLFALVGIAIGILMLRFASLRSGRNARRMALISGRPR